jgi:hypothetical protein
LLRHPTTLNALLPRDVALSFLAGIIAEANKLTRVAHYIKTLNSV